MKLRLQVKHIAVFFLLIFIHPSYSNGQVPTSIAPTMKLQFLSNAGLPLANGCLFTYQAGTLNPATTYVDSTGTGTNTNPIILDAGGRADVWIPNAAFKFQLKSAGGVNCASGSTIWTVDNISGILGLLNLNNIWTGTNVFNQAVTIAVNSNQIVAGSPGAQTTLNFPAPAGNITQNMLSTADTYVGVTASQTLTNKSLVSPIVTSPAINGVSIVNGPGAYISTANDIVTGTTLNTLTKMNGGTAIISSAGDTGGVIGITVAGAGKSGFATIQQTGSVAACIFDGSVTAGDYVQISTTVAGNCHDAGAVYPTSGQVIGRTTLTAVGAGTYAMMIFGPEIKPTANAAICTNSAPVTVTNTIAITNLMSCSIPANSLLQGSLLDINLTGINGTGSAMTIQISTQFGGATACATISAATLVASNQPWNESVKLFVLTSGAGGTGNMSCEYFSTTAGGGVAGPFGVVGAPTIAVNTTIANTLQVTVTMSVANANNTVSEQGLKAVIF